MKQEIKTSALHFELKAVGDEIQIEGFGSTFGGQPDSYGDIIEKGAFADSLKKRMPKMLYQHNSQQIAGKWLDAAEDNHGLYLKGIFIDTPISQQAYAECKAGVIDSMSIGFATLDSDFDPNTGIRTLKTLDLFEVSLVTFAANSNALISAVKSAPKTIREFEARLRDEFGLTHAQARDVARDGFKALEPARDEPDLTPLFEQLKAFNQLIKGN